MFFFSWKKNCFFQDFVFFQFFFQNFFLMSLFDFYKSCLSLIMGSGSQLEAKTIKYININSFCRVFYYKYTVSLKYVNQTISCFTSE